MNLLDNESRTELESLLHFQDIGVVYLGEFNETTGYNKFSYSFYVGSGAIFT